MKSMVFVRTSYLGLSGKIRANLANTTLKRGSYETSYDHSQGVSGNHEYAARCWISANMPGVSELPIGVQSYDNGYVFAFGLD
jgi:hypothetical protein